MLAVSRSREESLATPRAAFLLFFPCTRVEHSKSAPNIRPYNIISIIQTRRFLAFKDCNVQAIVLCRPPQPLLSGQKQNKTKQNKTKQNKTKQNKTKQNKTKQNKTKNKTQNKNKVGGCTVLKSN